MPPQLDVYRDWLKIEEAKRPLNYYQLLKLKKFEDDPVRIRHHYKQLNAHVRKYQAGDFAKQSQELLNELARAMLCLTDATRKEDYDSTLGRVQATKTGPRSMSQTRCIPSSCVSALQSLKFASPASVTFVLSR